MDKNDNDLNDMKENLKRSINILKQEIEVMNPATDVFTNNYKNTEENLNKCVDNLKEDYIANSSKDNTDKSSSVIEENKKLFYQAI